MSHRIWQDVFTMADNGHGWTVSYGYPYGTRVVYGPTDVFSCIGWAMDNLATFR